MKYRTLGATGLKISAIGFGCGMGGGLLIGGTPEERVRAVRRALSLGINYFDTAPSYGDGKSETHLGRALAEIGEEVVVSTKVRLATEALADIAGATAAGVEESLRRLGRESVDLIQLHNHVVDRRGSSRQLDLTPDDILGAGGVIAAFETLRKRGRVRHFGFTGLGEPAALHALVESGAFHSVQVYYNLLNPSAGDPVPRGFSAVDYAGLIERATAKGMGVLAIRVLASGVLSADPPLSGSRFVLSRGSDYASDVERARRLAFLVGGDVKNLSQAAIRFALMKPGVSSVLIGFANIKQIEEAAACSDAGPLSASVMDRLRNEWQSDFGRMG
jgi:aryl-alcohol dehydrogenase-like predicted oxidoreductase